MLIRDGKHWRTVNAYHFSKHSPLYKLQDKLEEEQRKNNGLSIKLANAVLIIKNLLHLWEDVMTEDTVKSMIEEAEQFLKGVEQNDR